MADLVPRSSRSFGVQTRVDLPRFMRSRMLRLRSRLGPRCNSVFCPICVRIVRPEPTLSSPKNVYIFRTNPEYHKELRHPPAQLLFLDTEPLWLSKNVVKCRACV